MQRREMNEERFLIPMLDATGRNFDPLESQAHTIHIRSQLLC